jgi:hypothetical protein
MDKYEKVRVLMIDTEGARRDFDAQIKALIGSF